jgi:localization factor PodJL
MATRPKASRCSSDAAGRGLVMADYRLAKLYERGEGVPRDMAASRQWTEKAAVGGNIKAMHDLAVFYAEGDAGPQSYAAAVEWFRQASDHGLVDSQYNLAVLYEQGLGLSQDKPEAAYWYEVAGRAGDQDAGRRARAMLGEMQPTQAEAIKRKARAFAPKPGIPRANGEFGRPRVGHRFARPDHRSPAPAGAPRLLRRRGRREDEHAHG